MGGVLEKSNGLSSLEVVDVDLRVVAHRFTSNLFVHYCYTD